MVATAAGRARAGTSSFYVWYAGICVLIAFGGFIPTYWAKIATGTFTGAPVLHFHGMLFFSWTLLFFAQTWLAAQGRIRHHQSFGILGVALASAMGISVFLAALNTISAASHLGMADQARRFAVVSLGALATCAVLFTLAIMNTHRPEIHKRLMVLFMVPLMQAAMARPFGAILAPGAVGPPPVEAAVAPGLLVCLLFVAAMIHDWRTIGRVHFVYLIGGPIIAAQIVLDVPLSQTDFWMRIVHALETLKG